MAAHFVKRAINRTFKGFQKAKMLKNFFSSLNSANHNQKYGLGEKEHLWNGPFTFIQGADTQLGMIATYQKENPKPEWEEEIKLTTKAIEAVNALTPRPRFFVVCGDLIDAMPGTALRSAQEEDFFKLFAKLNPDIPLVCVCGNHDLGDTPTPASVQHYRKTFGDDYFTFYCAGVMFIVVNSQYYEDPSLVLNLAKEQEVWLEKELAEAKTGKYKHVIVFQHIPWFVKTPDEEKIYFNMANDLRQRMLQKFYDANVRYIFCGHYHRNAGGFYEDMELVVTSAIGCQLGDDKSGFRIVKVLEDSVKHKYYALDEVPKSVDL